MTTYKKVVLKTFPQLETKSTEPSIWQEFKNPVIIKEFANVTSANYCSEGLAITASTRVQVYKKNELKKSISLKDLVHCCDIRKDGKLIACGDALGVIRIFDIKTKAVLRTLNGHKNVVRTLKFDAFNNLVSGGDDCSVKVWDIAEEKAKFEFNEHTDYCRAVAVDHASPYLYLSGSYDHTIKLWDARTEECTLTLDHGAPVEDALILKGGAVVVSCGGNRVKFWDVLNGGKLIQSLSHHQKNVTCLAIDATCSYLLTGSLDHQVKAISLLDYKVVKTIKYPSAILSLAISPTNEEIAVGMTGGLLCIRSRKISKAEIQEEIKRKLHRGTYQHLMRTSSTPRKVDVVIQNQRSKKLQPYDKFLKSFSYSEALNAALETKNTTIIVSVLDELWLRNGIKMALKDRDDQGLFTLLKFIEKHINNPKYSDMLIQIANVVLDMYQNVLTQSVLMEEVIDKLAYRVQEEIKTQTEISEVLGMLDNLFSVNQSNSISTSQ